jgi:CNT family concentrative nucleoside transporter
MPLQLISLFGLCVMVFLAWLMSANRWKVRPRIVIGGLALQFGFALLVLKTSPGRAVFSKFDAFFTTLLGFVKDGTRFVFGDLMDWSNNLFAFQVLPTIIFFSALMSLLYHFGVMQQVVRVMAIVMQKVLGTSGAESLSAAANIFVGQTEAPLVVRPYVALMTQSELMAVMVGGFATVAGGVMAAYVQMGIDAGHLVTASIISAPAALLIAKVMQPEVEQPKTLGRVELTVEATASNAIEAVVVGASDGMKLAINVAAMLIAFLALIAMFDYVLVAIGGPSWKLSTLLGYAFAPLAWLMGVERDDCFRIGELLGLRTAANEFLAYEKLAEWAQEGSDVHLSERSRTIATYALCGFANFSSIGIQIGGIGPLAPERQGDLARLGLRAMIGGMLACFMTACVAGILI